jgi:membrane-anchored protein YejM (alkaline phosphatase superfamily)
VQPPTSTARRALAHLLLANWAAGLLHVRPYLHAAGDPAGLEAVRLAFSIAAAVALLLALAGLVLAPLASAPRPLLRIAAPLLLAVLQLGLFVDARLHALFHFHLGPVALRQVLAPGALDAMGFSAGQVAAAALVAAGVVAGQAAVHGLLLRQATRRPGPPRLGRVLAGLAALFLLDAGLTAEAEVRGRSALLSAGKAVPLHGLAVAAGRALAGHPVAAREEGLPPAAPPGRTLAYPLRPLAFHAPAALPSMLLVVIDSWRADTLGPELTPNLWALSRRSLHFARHVTGGNETRTGNFTMFYGLPAPYFYLAKAQRVGPQLLVRARELGYRIHAISSVDFGYTFFSETVFADVPEALEDRFEGPIDQRDLAAAGRAAELLEASDGPPRLVVLFLDAPHTPYSFPPGHDRHRPYAASRDFWAATPTEAVPLKNRYLNGVEWADQVMGRLLARLGPRLDRLVLLVTGDHGEEFNEHGGWLHVGALHEEQIHVPLLLKVPGLAPGRRDDLTSHLDVAPTLLAMLGADGPSEDHASGLPLLERPPRSTALACNLTQCATVAADFSAAVFDVSSDSPGFEVFDADQRPDTSPGARARFEPEVREALFELGRFTR